jgi:hypothetical protein
MKELEIGKDYAAIFGYGDDKKLIYDGGNKWIARTADKEQRVENEKMTQNALSYINSGHGTGMFVGK